MTRPLRRLRPSGAALFRAFLVVCLLLALPAAGHTQDVGSGQEGSRSGEAIGPLQVEEYTPLARLGYTPAMEGAATLPAGVMKASLRLAYGNQFQLDSTATHDLVMDQERLLTAVGLRWGLTDAVELGGRLSFETTGGGFLDSWVEGLHGFLLLDNATRENYPENAYTQRLMDENGRTVLDIPARGFTLDEVQLQARWRIRGRPRSGSAVTLRGSVRIPTARNTVGDEATEAGVSVLARIPVGRFHLHGMLGAASVAGAPAIPQLRPFQYFATAAVEMGLSRSVSAILQAGGASSRLRDLEGVKVDGPYIHVVGGLRGRHGRWGWQAGFQEDTPGLGSSADFTLVVGVSRRW